MILNINDIQGRLLRLNTYIENQLNDLFREYPEINDFEIELNKQYDLDGKAVFNGLTIKAMVSKGILIIYDKPIR